MSEISQHSETLALHAGSHRRDPTTNSVAVPIYQTTSYQFDNTEHASKLFALQELGNIYTRIMNPTTQVLEERLAAIEGGVAALAVSSGSSAVALAIQNVASSGDNIVASPHLYGGTYNLFAHSLPRQGIDVRMASADDYDSLEKLIDDNSKLIFCESIGNPAGNIVDIEKLADIAHRNGIPLIVDNTVATPCLCRPFEHGADIVVHSLTKYIGGHGTTIGGIIIDSGKFNWTEHSDKFKVLCEPDPSYHGVVYTEALGAAAYIGRCRVAPLRNTGSALAPHSAFLLMQGLETLSLRMERHCKNAEAVANYLQNHPKVNWVKYGTLESSSYKELAEKITNGKASGILSFGIAGGKEAGAKFIDALRMILRLVNIGDAKSLACHPATTTHRQLNPEELEAAGVSEDLIRLSVGIEHIDDIIDDIEQAIESATQ